MAEPQRHSAPMSPLPPPPSLPRPDSLTGWVPAEADTSPAAIDARARSALRKFGRLESRVTDQETAIGKLATAVDGLNKTMGRLVRIFVFLGAPFILAIISMLAKTAYDWFVTLHH